MQAMETRAAEQPMLARVARQVAQERRRLTEARTGKVKGLRLGALMTAGRTAQAVALAELAAPTAKVRSFRMLDAVTQMESPAGKAAMERTETARA